jgi:ABC-2 type transport system ATP-binding protein
VSDASDLVIRAEGLRKEYGLTVAVEDLNLAVRRGEVFGFLGPNGAGKTTTLKMLLGLVHPTAGSVAVLGASPSNWQMRARVGFLPEHFRFQEWLQAREFLMVHAHLYGMPTALAQQRISDLLARLDLERHAQKSLRDFSKGMLQRIGLAQALLNKPELVFLDEPTSGLDPIGRRLVRDIIRELRADGITVFLNSHLLSEIEITCDRVAFIRRGRVVQTGPLSELLSNQTEVEIRAINLPADYALAGAHFGAWEALDGDRYRVSLADEQAIPALVSWLIAAGAAVYSVIPQHQSLEEFFMRVMEGEEAG